MIDEGYIKFKMNLTPAPAPEARELPLLNDTRSRLHQMGLIGIYDNGIGYGNISHRIDGGDTFIISGTATGGTAVLGPQQYCLVTSFDIAKNELHCSGPIEASSESMSHGTLYHSLPTVNVVIHIHSRKLFDHMLANNYPRTPESAAFGTPEIAEEIELLIKRGEGESGGRAACTFAQADKCARVDRKAGQCEEGCREGDG